MQYGKPLILIACLFFTALLSAQQYPFVHYSPKDGLVSNRIRHIYQDSKGRLYFCTANGLSVYDGARFINYTTEDGLHNDLVNCVVEMGDDSLWVVTNTNSINCLVKGKLKHLSLRDSTTPIINSLCRDTRGNLYAAADEGLFIFDKDHFVKLELQDMSGGSLTSYISLLVPYAGYLLVLRDYSLASWDQHQLYLYDPSQRKIISQAGKLAINNVSCAKDGRIWIGTNNGIRQLNRDSLQRGMIVDEELPAIYKSFSRDPCYVFFDNQNNCWLSDGTRVLKKCEPSGSITNFNSTSGLSNMAIGFIFHDKENTIWMASNEGGLEKLMSSDLSFIKKPFGLSWPSMLTLTSSGNEMIVYSYRERKAAKFSVNSAPEIFSINSPETIGILASTSKGLFGISSKKLFRIQQKAASAAILVLYTDTSENYFGNIVTDKNDNLLVYGTNYLTSFVGNTVSRVPIAFADQLAFDPEGNIWTATRREDLIRFSTHPDKPAAYLQQEVSFTKELKGLLPRSITIDKNGMIWIGTRYKGLYVFQAEKEKLRLIHHLTANKGLTENFVSYLVCDDENNIWSASPSGIDKIHLAPAGPVIENITRQNNMYQFISYILIDKNKTIWALSPAGLISIMTKQKGTVTYIPKLMISQAKAGTVVLDHHAAASLSYQQNDLSFNFSATSFLDEKQVLYSYRLQGRSNTTWSEPSNNATASFIGLRPGQYTLVVKAIFPAGRYPDQTTEYKFSIAPPWWQTWWFRIAAGAMIIAILIMIVRSYYRRKLEKQRAILEKQQAIEKERTRIATDMHDDLGAGLSTIRFLSEKVKSNTFSDVTKNDAEKIVTNSNDLVQKMNEIIWAMNEKNDTLEDLLFYTRSYAVEYCEENNLACETRLPEKIPAVFVSGEIRRNVFLTVKESLHNIVKHANAEKVIIDFIITNALVVTIKDDGKGFSGNGKGSGNGLRNMQKRIESVNGSFEVINTNAVMVKMTVPLQL
jgi:signal transduction histidine kinase